ncbi:hypothetical protein ACFW91_33680 [Streptomyces asoensis]|uniref:hypothetical protein n=1 Tax=Streptomyces asoensis TaxID=249586 RepID=UPI0036CB6180
MGYASDIAEGKMPIFENRKNLDEDEWDYGGGRAMTTSADLMRGQSGSPMFMRAGLALFGTASLTLAILMSAQQGVSFLVLLLSAVAGAVYGLLAYGDSSTLQAAIWQGAKVTASAAALGQAFLALYGR